LQAQEHNQSNPAPYSLINLAPDEDQRLAALFRLEILDTPPEPEFDELVQFAAALCHAPVSLITLVDEKRQWFKASFGVNVHGTAREVAFCNITIPQRDVVEIPDATLHPRLADNPDVTGPPHYRFYAGQTILSPDGYPLGSLCVLDFVPRKLSEAQTQALRILGQQVNARLQLRAQRIQLARANADLAAANQQLAQLAATDPLTGAANRRAFRDRLAADLSQARRKGYPLSLLLLDIDNFKQRNDCFGHEEGDLCLKQFASLLQRTARTADLVVRLGGEEFVVLLPETSEPQALQLGQRILDAVHAETWRCLPVTVSIGIASLAASRSDPDRLLQCADHAMYCAKRSGKDRMVIYTDQLGMQSQLGSTSS